MNSRHVFVTGGTGYMGSRLIPLLLARGHKIRALVRPGSQNRLPQGCSVVEGNALDRNSFAAAVSPADTFVQLIGVAHPSPAKAKQFREVDLVSVRESIAAAVSAKIAHFIYVSVAQPAPMMKEYIAVRCEGEALLRASGLQATILRPWYVLGPGHWWPMLLLPAYWVCERLPSMRNSARRLGLVSLNQMLSALVRSVEAVPDGVRVWEVPQIRGASER